MSQELALPAHLQNNEEAAKRALQDAASMSASSNSVPRISLRGREFRFVEGGEEIKKVRDKLRVIILGVEPEGRAMIKTWYKDGYKSGSKEPPTCSSDDGIKPSPWVQDKQAPACAGCPKNQFGSATSPSGKATKACRDSKRIWLREAESDVPFEDRTIYGLNVTVASLKSFSALGTALSGYGQSPCVAITELIMLDMEFPQLEFKLVGWLDAQTVPKSLEVNTKRPWKVFSSQQLLENNSTPATQLPGLPSHLQNVNTAAPQAPASAAPAGVTDVTPRPAPSNADIDDAVSKF